MFVLLGVLRSEKLVIRTQEAVEIFLNPFTVDRSTTNSFLGGWCMALEDVQKLVLKAEQTGRDARMPSLLSQDI